VTLRISEEKNAIVFARLGKEYSYLGKAVELIDEHATLKKSILDLSEIEIEERLKYEI